MPLEPIPENSIEMSRKYDQTMFVLYTNCIRSKRNGILTRQKHYTMQVSRDTRQEPHARQRHLRIVYICFFNHFIEK